MCNRWSLGMDTKSHPTHFDGCNYLSMLRLKLIHVSKRSPMTLSQYIKGILWNVWNLDHEFTFIGLSETWLNANSKELYNIGGYNNVSAYRENRKGGGVSLHIHEHLAYIERPDLNVFNDNIESIFVEVDKSDFSLDRNVVIGVLYRPPNTDIDVFNDYLGNILANVEREKKIFYIMGDYNINLLNHNSHPKTTSFLDTIYCKSFVPLINRPTSVSESSHTIIDNIITNNFAELKCSMHGIMLTDISDHFPVFTVNWNMQEKT